MEDGEGCECGKDGEWMVRRAVCGEGGEWRVRRVVSVGRVEIG